MLDLIHYDQLDINWLGIQPCHVPELIKARVLAGHMIHEKYYDDECLNLLNLSLQRQHHRLYRGQLRFMSRKIPYKKVESSVRKPCFPRPLPREFRFGEEGEQRYANLLSCSLNWDRSPAIGGARLAIFGHEGSGSKFQRTNLVLMVLKLIKDDGPEYGLHLNIDKTKVFCSKEDPRSRLACIFPPNIAWPLDGVKLLGGPASVDFDFCNELVLMDAIAMINDPQCELLLLHSCTGFGDWKWRSVGLQTKLLRHTGIVAFGPIFDDALSMFNTSMETNLLLVRVLSSSGVASYSDATLQDLMTKHPFHPTPFLPHIPIDHHHLIASTTVVLDRIKSFPRGTSCGRDGLRAQHLMDYLSGAVVAISDELASSITQVVSAIMIGHSLDGYLDGLQFGVGVSGGSEAIFHYVNRLIEFCGDDVGLSMLLVGFKNAFNLVDREVMLREVHLRCLAISRWVDFCYSNPARLYYGEATPLWSARKLGKQAFLSMLGIWDDGTILLRDFEFWEGFKLIMEDWAREWLCYLNIDKTEVFGQRKTLEEGMQLVAKTIVHMDAIA
ncbi:hypothetical protein Tco_1149685 [Tanacetum coccineum]